MLNRPARFERITLGPTPPDEECVQLGHPDYYIRAHAECLRYRQLITKIFGQPPPGATLMTVGHSHDFGVYYEVAVQYEVGDPLAEAYAFAVDDGGPQFWDDDEPREWRPRLQQKRSDSGEEA